MNPTLFTASAALLAAVLWLALRRRPVVLLRSTDASAVAALNRAQIERPLVAVAASPSSPATPAPRSLPLAGQGLERRLLLRDIQAGVRADAAQRLAAIELAGRWGHPTVLPLLRRGLRDVDPAVVAAAAAALERFRGCPRLRQARASAQASAPPRNVARTR